MMPHVTCICLTADRQKFTERAVKCFLSQTYPNKALIVYDNGKEPYINCHPERVTLVRYLGVILTIGALRNAANKLVHRDSIIAHWDSDDWSHPLRLAWQVRELTGGDNGAKPEAVGYRSMMFWDSRNYEAWHYEDHRSWYGIGTSLMYWRKTWEKKPFAERNRPGVPPEKDFGEDHEWIKGLNVIAAPGFFKEEPAMVAEMHGGNLTNHDGVMHNSPQWRRAMDWDERLVALMKL